jgi:DMSO/TMAO reductase YedYZ molybdopterin-dependent catalytic subunit
VLLGLCLWHLLLRCRPLSGRDLHHRRSLLRLMAILAGGGIFWAGIESAQRAARTAGRNRRFTGSRLEVGAFPVTMWMFDNPVAVDAAQYRLMVGGAVAKPLHVSLSDLAHLPQTRLTATLDCTGGWYSEEAWQGIRVAELLARAEPHLSARYVRFRSVTGYRWSMPLEEASDMLLATSVGDLPLDHGHGAPLRLVAPGRRGFQWVKWVVAVEVLDAPDLGQWGAIFTSGLDGA